MIDAVLLEFEGVIADTHGARRAALLEVLGEDGVKLTEIEYRERCDAMPVRSAVRAAFAVRKLDRDETTIELVAMRAERRFAMAFETGMSLVDGVRDLIRSLHGRARLGIVSRASRAEIDSALAMAELDQAFEFVITDDDAYQPKPSPAPYLGALDRLARRRAVTPHNVVALEDGAVGIRAAKSAGVRCAVVGSLPVHVAVDADALIPSLVGQTIASIDAVTLGQRGAQR